MSESNELKYELKPRFNIIYELNMPTGKKIKTDLVLIILFLILYIYVTNNMIGTNVSNISIFENFDLIRTSKILFIVVLFACILKLILNVVFQILQYKNISYKFYDDHLVYEDDFLNQHKKSINYADIKEMEIRRTIIDRIIGYGIIVIYTNAESKRNSGLVIYGIKDPKSHYEAIEKIIKSNR